MIKNKNILKKEVLKANKSLSLEVKALDEEERKMLNDYKNNSINDIELLTDKDDLQDFIKAQKEYKKSRQITIRVQNNIIDSIKQKAETYGLNYQTYINIFLNQLAKGELQLILK